MPVPVEPTDNRPIMLALPDIRLATPLDAPAIARMSRDCIEQGLSWSWTAVPCAGHSSSWR